jgi:hypothetical protein
MSKVRKGFAWTNKMSTRRFTLLRFTPRPRFFTRGTRYFKSAVSRLSFRAFSRCLPFIQNPTTG